MGPGVVGVQVERRRVDRGLFDTDEVASGYRCAYRAAYRLLGARSEAEDVAQEAVARALLRWPSIQGHVDAWSTRVAINLALDRHKRRARERHGVPPSGSAPNADGQREVRLDLVSALRRLPRRQREVVTLRYIGDLTQEQVAEMLGCSVGTVKQHASRGLTALRDRLGPDIEIEEP